MSTQLERVMNEVGTQTEVIFRLTAEGKFEYTRYGRNVLVYSGTLPEGEEVIFVSVRKQGDTDTETQRAVFTNANSRAVATFVDAVLHGGLASPEETDRARPVMTLARANRKRTDGPPAKGFVLYGNVEDGDTRRWFERWFPSQQSAEDHAGRKGWLVEVKVR